MKVSSSAVEKTIKHYDETGSYEDRHRKGRSRVTSAAEDKFISVTSLRKCSPNKCFRVQVANTSQHQLFRGDGVNQAIMVELLQRNYYLRTPIKRRDLLGPRNTSNHPIEMVWDELDHRVNEKQLTSAQHTVEVRSLHTP